MIYASPHRLGVCKFIFFFPSDSHVRAMFQNQEIDKCFLIAFVSSGIYARDQKYHHL